MKKGIRNLLLGLAGIASLGAGRVATSGKFPLVDSKIEVIADGKNLEVPVYGLTKVRNGRCATYARRAAEELFGKEYSYSDGWDRKYNDIVISKVKDNNQLEELEIKGILKPGMMVGAYYPGSPYLGKTDEHGHLIDYTHNLVYLGRNPEGRLLFADQAKFSTQVRTLEDLAKKGIEARDLIDVRLPKNTELAE